MRVMLKDVIPFGQMQKYRSAEGRLPQSISTFISFIENRLGGHFFYDVEQIPYGRTDIVDLFDLALLLESRGVIKNFSKRPDVPDEPRMRVWAAEYVTKSAETAGGLSGNDDRAALTATLAEALERHLWHEAEDYFRAPFKATAAAAARRNVLSPSRFVGFSDEQRQADKKISLSDSAEYLWIRGHSWISNAPIYIPAQIVSACHMREGGEPIIRNPITTGLATWPTREGAILSGALEVIERDAFMIMWLNQLVLPRIAWTELRHLNSSLDALLRTCARYRLEVRLLSLITDAPASIACVVVLDRSSVGPPLTIGLKASVSLSQAAEGALLEALRARRLVRERKVEDVAGMKPKHIGHFDRLPYWSEKSRHARLAALFSGTELPSPPSAPWERDSREKHLQRIIDWCRTVGYELVSVNLGRSRKNPTPWKVEMVVMPDLQPMHLSERYQYLDGSRLQAIPQMFGYAARTAPFFEEPHPFV